MANANDSIPSACDKCGKDFNRPRDPLVPAEPRAESKSLCELCEKARIEEISRIDKHHEDYPEDCCCHTYLGRECCMAPIHGDLYLASCIEHGDRFYIELRAKSLKEAKEFGQDSAAVWGGECIGVRKIKTRQA